MNVIVKNIILRQIQISLMVMEVLIRETVRT